MQSNIPEDVMIRDVQNLLNMHCAMIGTWFLATGLSNMLWRDHFGWNTNISTTFLSWSTFSFTNLYESHSNSPKMTGHLAPYPVITTYNSSHGHRDIGSHIQSGMTTTHWWSHSDDHRQPGLRSGRNFHNPQPGKYSNNYKKSEDQIMLTWLLQISHHAFFHQFSESEQPWTHHQYARNFEGQDVPAGDRVGGNPIPISLRDGWKIQQGSIGNMWKYTNLHGSRLFHDVYFLAMLVETGVQENHGTKKQMTLTLYTPPVKNWT